MYRTAHRVVDPASGREGINAFCYEHPGVVWQGLPPEGIPDVDPGVLAAQHLELPPPGNRVRSYLDIVSPDETPAAEVRSSLLRFLSEAQGRPLPWEGVVGRCLFRLGVEADLAPDWPEELATLYRAIDGLRYPRASPEVADSKVA